MNNTTIKAEIVAHSINPQGDELISVLCTFPRIILAEVNTHRMLSKNTSSSRAIPFKKMVESVENDPFIPIAWQKSHSGMQGSEYFTDKEQIEELIEEWLYGRNTAVTQAKILHDMEVTKQLVNRLLEPFMWTTMLITGSREGWDNFFHLRCPQYNIGEDKFYRSKKDALKDVQNRGVDTEVAEMFVITDFDWLKANKGQAEIHIMDLAEKILDAVNESTPKQLYGGEWHIPFEDKIQWSVQDGEYTTYLPETLVKISTAMAARTSYTVVGDEKGINAERMIELHDRLLSQDPPHSSPLEHCARAMTDIEYETFIKGQVRRLMTIGGLAVAAKKSTEGWCNNFKGFIPYRYMVDNN